MVKYVVRLKPEAREQLRTLGHTGRGAAAKLLPARILLKAEVSAASRRWTEGEIVEALETRASTVHRVRQAWVDQGREAAWARPPRRGGQSANSTAPRRPSALLGPAGRLQKAGPGGRSSD